MNLQKANDINNKDKKRLNSHLVLFYYIDYYLWSGGYSHLLDADGGTATE